MGVGSYNLAAGGYTGGDESHIKTIGVKTIGDISTCGSGLTTTADVLNTCSSNASFEVS
jgi:hypothetical protein